MANVKQNAFVTFLSMILKYGESIEQPHWRVFYGFLVMATPLFLLYLFLTSLPLGAVITGLGVEGLVKFVKMFRG